MQHGVYLLAGDREFIHDLFHGQACFQILKYSGYRHAVSLNTQAPLTLPGMLSTAGHCDQSSDAKV